MRNFVKDIKPQKLRGLKIATIGLLSTILGFILFLLEIDLLGRIILYSGMAIVFIGMCIHVYLMFTSPNNK